MFDHLGLKVANLDASVRFYTGALAPLGHVLAQRLHDARGLPGQFRTRLETTLEQAVAFAEEVADNPSKERFTRIAASSLYHITTAIAMAYEGAQIGAHGGDARRMLMARFVLEHRLSDQRKLSADGGVWEEPAISALLDETAITVEAASSMLVA